ncbi:hypothetical protein VKT23_019563 [Stygiomarasmius scandens]|uniref:Uncharacterized protein n=1 Tax=Marasmiellus scandens TaxID=2682957 RepID=A0ABR1IQ82_9AGAR
MARAMHVGIAFYNQTDRHGWRIDPHWAIIAHETNYNDSNTQIYQITRTKSPRWNVPGWKLDHKICNPFSSPYLIGILHVGTVELTRFDLDCYGQFQTENRDEKDESGLEAWSCEAWVIRFLRGLHTQRLLWLNHPPSEIYEYVTKVRIPALKQASKMARAPAVIDSLL